MKCERYYYNETTKEYRLLYGVGQANLLAYLTQSGFRDWKFYGFVQNESSNWFSGITLEGTDMVPVWGATSMKVESEELVKEALQIAAGKTEILCFHGRDNSSFMRRLSPVEFESCNLTSYKKVDSDLFYNS